MSKWQSDPLFTVYGVLDLVYLEATWLIVSRAVPAEISQEDIIKWRLTSEIWAEFC